MPGAFTALGVAKPHVTCPEAVLCITRQGLGVRVDNIPSQPSFLQFWFHVWLKGDEPAQRPRVQYAGTRAAGPKHSRQCLHKCYQWQWLQRMCVRSWGCLTEHTRSLPRGNQPSAATRTYSSSWPGSPNAKLLRTAVGRATDHRRHHAAPCGRSRCGCPARLHGRAGR